MRNPVIPFEVKALTKALHLQHPQVADLLSLDDRQWRALLKFSDLAHLTLPLAILNLSGLPGWVSERLKKNLEDNRLRFRRVKKTYEEAAEALRLAQIEHLVIKGFTLSPEFVASPWLRQQSDLDFLCLPEDLERAQASLVAIGYAPDKRLNYKFADHSPTLYRLGNWQWQGNAFDPDMPLSIELHYCLWNSKLSLFRIDEIAHFFARREVREIEGLSSPSLNCVDRIGHLALHIVRNLLNGDAVVHHLFELASLLNAKSFDHCLWIKWQELHSKSLRSKEILAFDLARRWFGCELPPMIETMIAELPQAQQQWLAYFTFSSLEGIFRENKDAIWLHWSLIEETQQKASLLRRHFFPNLLPNPDIPVAVLNARKIRAFSQSSGRWSKSLRFISYCCRRSIPYCALRIRALYRGALWTTQQELYPR